MPELVPIHARLVELAGDDDLAARVLSLYRPPGFVVGCSQGAWTRAGAPCSCATTTTRPARLEGIVYLTEWTGRRVLGMSDCLWGLLDGINEDGLAVSLTFGGRRDVGDGFGVPLVVRYLLETCATVGQAREALARIPVHAAQNLTLLDRSGDYLTAYVGPGRPPEFHDRAATTNHQGEVEWPEYAAAIRTVERERCVLDLLGDPELTRARFVESFLEPPLHNTGYSQGFGTLYTAAYFPAEGRVEYRWPGVVWEQSLDGFARVGPHAGVRRAGAAPPAVQADLNASAPAGGRSSRGATGLLSYCALDAVDPLERALGQPVVVVLHARARDDHAEVGARVGVVARREHAQEERLGLVLEAVPVVAPAREADAARLAQPPDPGPRRRAAARRRRGVLEHELAPDVELAASRPARVDVVDVDLVVDVDVLEQVEQEQRDVGVRPGRDVGHRRHAADPRVELAEVELAAVDVDQVVDLEEAAVSLAASRSPSCRVSIRARSRCSGESASGKMSFPHQPPLCGVSSGWPMRSFISGPTTVPWRVSRPRPPRRGS